MTDTPPTGPHAAGAGPHAGTGPLAEELARLLTAAGDYLHRSVRDPATSRIANGAPECAWCPVCQLISAMRGGHRSPEQFVAGVADLQGVIAGFLHTLADSVASGGSGGSGGTGGTDGTDRPAADRADQDRVQRIDLSDGD
ncbi:hypothetical protein M6D93_13100 [Jatrophihabitans telluris]|uniref:Uncharacterized protein n=1 Tax=Jatrophihabitans telluris TaxID=2038343 RepID=A0ABY4QUU5_9ACTN|nr:hypothetical protein [Jatrophihabitans telluris]UQX87235.1 hypothetical protein M6D93_13100 [Jatrophihabitans telluris]